MRAGIAHVSRPLPCPLWDLATKSTIRRSALFLPPPPTRFDRHPVAVIEENPLVNAGNSDMMVETVREVAELVTWGDKHNPLITECFLERFAPERSHILALDLPLPRLHGHQNEGAKILIF
jgi:hypothetical protein